MAFNLKDFLTNPDILYMMGGLGAGLSAASGNPFGATAGQLTMASITAENQRKLLERILGLGGEVKLDKEKTAINLPTQSFMTGSSENSMKGQGVTAPQTGGQQSTINPYIGSLSSLEGLSLAGLTPADIRSTLQLGIAMEELRRKRLEDLAQQEYHKEALESQKALRQVQIAKALEEKKTTAMREYEKAVEEGSFKGSFLDWQNYWKTKENMPTSLKEYLISSKDPNYLKFLEERAKWGKLSVEEEAARADAVSRVRGVTQIWDDVDKYRMSTQYRRDVMSRINDLDKDPDIAKYPFESKHKLAEFHVLKDYIKARLKSFNYDVDDPKLDLKNPGVVIFTDKKTGRTFEYVIK